MAVCGVGPYPFLVRKLWPALLLLGAVPLAHAEGPLLHEFVPEVAAEEGELLVQGGGIGDEPAALMYDGEVLPAPERGAPRGGEQALSAGAQPAGGPSFRPDRLTELEGTLGYQAVFTPSITPFKRVTALDAVRLDSDGETPVLVRRPGRSRALRIEGADVAPPDGRPRERFWGEVVLDFSEGRRVPLPSVSPESRILTVRTEPDTALRFEKDGAGAFHAVAVGGLPDEPVRLVFLTDAPRTYFGGPIPDVAADTLAHEVPPLPAGVRSRGLAFAAELGLGPDDNLRPVLRTLAGHFRSFEESAIPPPDQGDIFLDLARAKKGVCRHRTYAFVVTAQALGIPARFVYNEAHSFAEVKMPGAGWMRVDLGGAARGLEAHGAEDRPVHRSPEADPLPRPEGYEQSYSQLGGDVSGVRRDRDAQWAQPLDEPASEREAAGAGAASTPSSAGSGGASGGSTGEPAAPSPAPARAETLPEEETVLPLRIGVSRRRYQAYRGRSLEVAGRITGPDEQGVGGLRVEVLLRRRGERLLGVTVTDDRGWFQGSFAVPPRVPVGDYDLLVRTPGDDGHAPASAY